MNQDVVWLYYAAVPEQSGFLKLLRTPFFVIWSLHFFDSLSQEFFFAERNGGANIYLLLLACFSGRSASPNKSKTELANWRRKPFKQAIASTFYHSSTDGSTWCNHKCRKRIVIITINPVYKQIRIPIKSACLVMDNPTMTNRYFEITKPKRQDENTFMNMWRCNATIYQCKLITAQAATTLCFPAFTLSVQ